MFYQIADLIVDMPAFGQMPAYMQSYETADKKAQIVLGEGDFLFERWKNTDLETQYYMETGWIFYKQLLHFNGMMLHASAVVLDGYAYLFSGPCGMGKSTHTGLYQQVFGEKAVILNDDKPALRRIDGQWYAYGTPWSGKNHINQNSKAKLAGICFLHRGDTKFNRLDSASAVRYFLGQTQKNRLDADSMRSLLALLDKLVREVPIFELYSHASREDALLSYTEMTKAIKETE